MWTTDDSDNATDWNIDKVSPTRLNADATTEITLEGKTTLDSDDLSNLEVWLYFQQQPAVKTSVEVKSVALQQYSLVAQIDLEGWTAGADLKVVLCDGNKGAGYTDPVTVIDAP